MVFKKDILSKNRVARFFKPKYQEKTKETNKQIQNNWSPFYLCFVQGQVHVLSLTSLPLMPATNVVQAIWTLWMGRESCIFTTRRYIAAKEIPYHVPTFQMTGNATLDQVRYTNFSGSLDMGDIRKWEAGGPDGSLLIRCDFFLKGFWCQPQGPNFLSLEQPCWFYA